MVYIRTDVNEDIATGHMMRCLTIAEKIKESGEDVEFIISEEESKNFLISRFDFIMLKSDFYDNEDEIIEMIEILKKSIGVKLILDLYKFDAKYMKQLMEYAKIITFDDMFSEKYPVNLLINYNLYYTAYDYKTRYSGEKTKLLLGGKYVPLRSEFQMKCNARRDTVKKLMLICGGGDKFHFLLDMLKNFKDSGFVNTYSIVVVAGPLNGDFEELKQYEKKCSGIEVLRNVKNMASIMKNVDLIISAAGTVLYESCSFAIPTIFFSIADNQLMDAQCFGKNDLMVYVGDIRIDKHNVIQKIVSEVEKLTRDKDRRCKMMAQMKKTIDYKGTERIVREILKL